FGRPAPRGPRSILEARRDLVLHLGDPASQRRQHRTHLRLRRVRFGRGASHHWRYAPSLARENGTLLGAVRFGWRWRWDLNPRRLAPHTLSRRAPSATRRLHLAATA